MPKALTHEEMLATEASDKPKAMTHEEMQAFEAQNTPNPRDPYNPMVSALIGAGEGASLGFEPQLEGVLRGGYNALTSDKPLTGENLLNEYRKTRDAAKLREQQARADNPKSYLAGNVAGTVGTGFVPGLGVLNAGKEAGVAAKLGLAATTGALGGAGYSDADLTTGDPEQFRKIGKDMLHGAETGAVTQGALSALGTVAGAYHPTASLKSIAESTPEKLALFSNAAGSLPLGFDKTAKFIEPIVGPGANALLGQGAIKAAATINKVLESEGVQAFGKLISPIVEAAKNGNSTAAVTMYLIKKQHPDALNDEQMQSLQQGAPQ